MRTNVAIAIPAQDHCATWFAYDLARLMGYSVAQGLGVSIVVLKTAYLPSSRQQLADLALEHGADAILWLDSDMRFPKDALVRLLAHDLPVVAASYSMRRLPLAPVAFDGFDQSRPHLVANDAEGLERVAMVGMGCMLTRRSVFDGLPRPWFANPWDEARQDFIGEDVWFCQRLAEAGHAVWIDAGLTNAVSHLGEWGFTNAQLNEWTERRREAERPRLVTA